MIEFSHKKQFNLSKNSINKNNFELTKKKKNQLKIENIHTLI